MNVVYWDGISQAPFPLKQHVLTIGNFDGVHQGHATLLRHLLQMKERLHKPAMVVTFDPSPTAILRPEVVIEPLTTVPQRIELLRHYLIDTVLVLCSTPALLELSALSFWNDFLRTKLDLQGIVEGQNFCFGRHRQGRIEELRMWSNSAQLPCEIVHDVSIGTMRVSSSEIRSRLNNGDIDNANLGLGRCYSITGKVIEGDKRGRTIGFPTCNLAEIPTLIPLDGVYVGKTIIAGKIYAVALNIGPNPTFNVEQRKVEAHLIDFRGDLYGQSLSIELIARLRDTRRFGSMVELQQQLNNDVTEVRRLASLSMEH